MTMRTSTASEPRHRRGVWGPRAGACWGSGGEAPGSKKKARALDILEPLAPPVAAPEGFRPATCCDGASRDRPSQPRGATALQVPVFL